jgi:hypothetical protein
MALSQEAEPIERRGRVPSKVDRSLVLVAGSGRSGTSLFSGILQRLGFYVPEPEVPADSTNPRGFAESKWVVDFHTRLLSRVEVQTADARPGAWGLTASVALEDDVHEELRAWLGKQFAVSDHVLIKDPRLSWFLPLWRRCTEEAGIEPRFVTVLRHPATVVDSKQRYYGGWQTDVSRTAGWLNQALFTERATREGPRVFVRYDDLLEDWTKIVGRVGETLDLSVVRDAPASTIVSIHDFVDRGLSRSRATWEDIGIPQPLRDQVDAVWKIISGLADEGALESEATISELDAARAAYVALYEDAEAIAQSSVVASARSRKEGGGRLVRLAGKVPRGYREKIPLGWRRAVYRAVQRGERRGR